MTDTENLCECNHEWIHIPLSDVVDCRLCGKIKENTNNEKLAIAIKTLEGISKMARISWELDYHGSLVYIEDFANETLEQIKGNPCETPKENDAKR